MSISTQFINALQGFAVYFVELSALFLGINMLVSYLNARFSRAVQKHLHGDAVSSYLKAMLLGAMTPFCSCSTIPFFVALLRNKIPLGVSFAYLITSPLVNPIIVAIFLASFGINLTLAYIIFVAIAVLLLCLGIARLKQEALIKEGFLTQNHFTASCCDSMPNSQAQKTPKFTTQSPCCAQKSLTKTRTCCAKNPTKESETNLNVFKKYWNQSFADYKKILPYLVIGMAIGAFIHDFIPQGSLESVLKEFGYFGVVIAAFVALLLYIRVEAIIPIGLGLINAGVPLGVIMSLLIAGGGCSLPELILLKSIFTLRLLLLFMAMVLGIAIGFGSFVLAFI
ncbi:MAG: permease [Helicobacter sp.]|nr:permease [Helicobacter sp.]